MRLGRTVNGATLGAQIEACQVALHFLYGRGVVLVEFIKTVRLDITISAPHSLLKITGRCCVMQMYEYAK